MFKQQRLIQKLPKLFWKTFSPFSSKNIKISLLAQSLPLVGFCHSLKYLSAQLSKSPCRMFQLSRIISTYSDMITIDYYILNFNYFKMRRLKINFNIRKHPLYSYEYKKPKLLVRSKVTRSTHYV
jgi:hypothetical protein